MNPKKYYIPFRLKRSIMLGPIALADAAVLLGSGILLVPMAVTNVLLLFPLFVYAIGAIQINGRTLRRKALCILSYLKSNKNYTLKECFVHANNRPDKV